MVAGALLLAAAAVWGSSRMTWSAERRDAGVRGAVLATENGAQHSGALVPLAVLALAGVAAMVATGGWVRRMFGVLLALAGVAVLWIAVDGLRFGYPADTVPIVSARILAVAGGMLMLGGGAAGAAAASRMPRLGARYAAPGDRKARRDPDVALWDALSEGEDPTAGP